MEKYNPNKEYKININGQEAKKEIETSKILYDEFKTKHIRALDFEKPSSIDVAFEDAKEMGVFEKAQNMRELFFGKDMSFYGVVYLWDACVNHCSYCPGSIPNRKKAIEHGNEYPLRELSVEQAVVETLAVMEDGHTHVCYLSGSSPGRERLPDKIVPYLEAIDDLGLDEIILNIEPPTDQGFRKIRDAVRNTAVQFRIFQETYDRETYARMHPRGPKADYDFRKSSQARAAKAGFDNIGLGALFGLHRFPIEEIENLRLHAEELETNLEKRPARICLPSANELRNIGVDIPYFIKRGSYNNGRDELVKKGHYEKFDELLYAVAKLAMPTISIVSSERDGPAMLRILDNYATCTTLNVHSGVGDNANIFCRNGQEGKVHFEQTTDFPREPKKTVKDLIDRGFNPIINTNME